MIILINNKFQSRRSKNKNVDHRDKESCANMSTQVTYETDHISLQCDSTISSSLKF